MTSIKDPGRQASLFTMNGIPDPRLMDTATRKTYSRKRITRLFELVEAIAMRKTIFRFRN